MHPITATEGLLDEIATSGFFPDPLLLALAVAAALVLVLWTVGCLTLGRPKSGARNRVAGTRRSATPRRTPPITGPQRA